MEVDRERDFEIMYLRKGHNLKYKWGLKGVFQIYKQTQVRSFLWPLEEKWGLWSAASEWHP